MTKRTARALVFVCLYILAPAGRAMETDDFPPPGGMLPPPATADVDRMIAKRAAEFVARHNENDFGCDLKVLNQNAIYFFDQNFSGIGHELADVADGADSPYKIGFFGGEDNAHTLYKDADVLGCCAKAINLEGIRVGIDKVDHFFGNGGVLYSEYLGLREKTGEDKALDAVMLMSSNQEAGWWGLRQTHVKSYGDLSANWSGLEFYRNLFGGKNPYFGCQGGQLTQLRPIKIEDYVKPSWSESMNCSAFVDKTATGIIAANLRARGQTCPVKPGDCDQVAKAYTNSPREQAALVSPVCRNHIQFQDSIERVGPTEWRSFSAVVSGADLKDVGNVFNKFLFHHQGDAGTDK